MEFLRRLSRVLPVSAILLSLSCSKQFIPNTDVEDSPYNRKIIEFCEEYRHAVERRSVGVLLKLADKRYYEDGGNVDPTDDLNYDDLKKYLMERFRHTQATVAGVPALLCLQRQLQDDHPRR